MSSRIGDPSDPFEDEGLASPEPGMAGKRITGDPQDDMPVPGDRPVAVNDRRPSSWMMESARPGPIDTCRRPRSVVLLTSMP